MADNFNSSEILFDSILNGENTQENMFAIELQLKLLILQGGFDIDARNSMGFTPLLLAAKLNRKNIVELLLDHGANVDCREYLSNLTLLHRASCVGWTDMVQSLVKRVIDINVKDKFGATALHLASNFGYADIVKCLVAEGVDINAQDNLGATPLLVAAYCSKRDIFDLLLNAGADVDICDLQNDTVLHYASQHGNEWLEVVQSLVKKVSDLNVRNIVDQTALLIACQFGNLDVVDYLFEAGASCDIVDSFNNSPLHYLIKMERSGVKLIKLFMKNMADLLPADYDALLKSSLLKVDILEDVNFCCEVIVNKFNNRDLPELYELPIADGRLPRMEEMKIVSCTKVFQTIEQTVRFEIQTKGHCNPFKVCLNGLKMLCVKSCLEYYG